MKSRYTWLLVTPLAARAEVLGTLDIERSRSPVAGENDVHPFLKMTRWLTPAETLSISEKQLADLSAGLDRDAEVVEGFMAAGDKPPQTRQQPVSH